MSPQLQTLMRETQLFLGLPGRRQKTVEANMSISVNGLDLEHKKGLGTLGRADQEQGCTSQLCQDWLRGRGHTTDNRDKAQKQFWPKGKKQS